MRFDFWRDSVLGTAFIFFLIGFVVQFFSFFTILDPIGDALSDVDITDVVFSRMQEPPPTNENIVIVNIGNLDRLKIGEQIRIINKYDPKVIGVDAYFYQPKPQNPLGDTVLSQAFSGVKNLVLASKLTQPLQGETENYKYDSLQTSHPIFNKHAHNGFANLITQAEEQDQYKVCRKFPPSATVKGKGERLAFTVKIAQQFDSTATEKFLQRNNQEELINYQGNITGSESGSEGNAFYSLDVNDVLNENFTPELIKDKIVLFGFMGRNFQDNAWEDKFFTPLNNQYAGRTNPDMYGVVVHANILSMILNGNYIDTMSDTASTIIGIILCFFNVVLFTLVYRLLPYWYDGITKLTQLIEVAILLFIIVYVFHLFNYKLNLTLGIGAILLAGDSLEVFYGVIKNLFIPDRRKEVFRIHKEKI